MLLGSNFLRKGIENCRCGHGIIPHASDFKANGQLSNRSRRTLFLGIETVGFPIMIQDLSFEVIIFICARRNTSAAINSNGQLYTWGN